MKVTFKTYDILITTINQNSGSEATFNIDSKYDQFLKFISGKEMQVHDFSPYEKMFKISIPEIGAYDKYISCSFIDESLTDFEGINLLFCMNCGTRISPTAKFWLYPSRSNQEAIDGWDTTSKNYAASVDVSEFAQNGKIRCQVCRTMSAFKKVQDYNI